MARNQLEKLLMHPISLAAEAIIIVICLIVLSEMGKAMGGPAQEATNRGIDAIMILVNYGPPVIFGILVILVGWAGHVWWKNRVYMA